MKISPSPTCASRQADQGVHPGVAVAGDGVGRDFLRHAGHQRGDARDVRRIRGLGDAPEDHLVNLRRVNPRPVENAPDDDAGEFLCVHVAEDSAVVAHRRADGVNDDDFFHLVISFV
jgi:hypothetical protein